MSESLKRHQRILANNEHKLGKLTDERRKNAASVFLNDEWRNYVADTIDSLRASALLEGVGNPMDRETLLANLSETRGAINALTEAYEYFENCHISERRDAADN